MLGIVHGGYSTERDVSTLNANYIYQALIRRGYEAMMLQYDETLTQKLVENNIDFVFICVQGKGHGDGTIQGLLDFMRIPYTGSGMTQAAVINDKIICKKLFDYHGFTTPAWKTLKLNDYINGEYDISGLSYPFVSKAPSQGGSFGIFMIKNEKELPLVEKSFIYDETILLEKFAPGTFVTVGVLENGDRITPLPCVEGVDKSERKDDLVLFMGDYGVIPSSIPKSAQKRLQELSVDIFKAFDCRDYARIDFIVNDAYDRFDLLEINAVPGLKPKSLLPNAAKIAGIAYDDLIEGILINARRRAHV